MYKRDSIGSTQNKQSQDNTDGRSSSSAQETLSETPPWHVQSHLQQQHQQLLLESSCNIRMNELKNDNDKT